MKVAQSCPTLCDPMDFTVCGILQARILEWVAIPFSRGSSQPQAESSSPPLQVDPLPAEPPGKPSVGDWTQVREPGGEAPFLPNVILWAWGFPPI